MRPIYHCIFASLLLTGCMVGPNYHPPQQYLPEVFCEDRGEVIDPMVDEDLAHWWTAFNDPFLDELLREALEGSFDLNIALERVCQARALFWVQFTGLLPDIESDFQATRTRTSQSLTSSPFFGPPIQSFYQTGFDAIWEIDVFGGLRRAARAAYRAWEATEEDARNARITVLGEVGITYVNISALQQRRNIAEQTVHLDEELAALSQARFASGLTNEQEVEAALATLENDRAALKVLETSLKQTIYSLAVLLGRLPEGLLTDFTIERPLIHAEGKLPLGLPSELLRRRPDIRSAERLLAEAMEQIGVAVADLFPKFSLTGSSSSFSSNPLQGSNIGFASNTLRKLFTAPSLVWGLGGLVTWPVFDFGQRLATVNAQVHVKNQAFYTYEKTVVSALQEVESDLVAYFNEEERLRDFTLQAEANYRTLTLALDEFQAGLIDYTAVLQAKETWLVSESLHISSQQALSSDLIALYKALGGGWECCYMP